jgi:hypothetical protein
MCMPLPAHLHPASTPSPVPRNLIPMCGTDSGFRFSSSILGTSTSPSLQEPHSAYICDSCAVYLRCWCSRFQTLLASVLSSGPRVSFPHSQLLSILPPSLLVASHYSSVYQVCSVPGIFILFRCEARIRSDTIPRDLAPNKSLFWFNT